MPAGNDADRRVRNVTITQKGIDLVKKATQRSRGRSSELLFRSLDEDQLRSLNQILKILRRDALESIRNMDDQDAGAREG